TIGYPNEPIKVMNNSVGTGPYMIDHYTANSEIVLKRNPHYWGKKPQLDGARYVWRKESAVAAAMVKVGEAHVATNISHQDATDPKTDFAYPNSETNYLRIESLVPPLNDKRVRLALNYAVDRQALHGAIIPKQAMIATQMVIPRIAGHNHALDKQRFEYSPDRAKKLLAEARAAGVKVDTPIDFLCRINQWENTTETCEAILAMYTAVGLNVKLRMLEVSLWVNHNTHPNKGPLTPEADAKIKGRGPVLLGHMHDNNVGDPVFSMNPKYACKAQTSSHCIPELDKKIEAATQTPAGPQRTKLWEETMAMVHDNVLDVFLFHMVGFARVSPKINFVPTAATNSEILLEQITFK
ncbi:MAG TPA: ABC transporter substrate-binding protein, partial [Nitrospiraceae bacterium]|nr:ABC transporter substrate-binding protein [Nitrospiraceae bacterium]